MGARAWLLCWLAFSVITMVTVVYLAVTYLGE
jgi:hypothetical protein